MPDPMTPEKFYDAVVAVIDAVKSTDRPEGTDVYASAIFDAAGRYRQWRRTVPLLSVLHVRGDDSGCDVRIFTDDGELDPSGYGIEDVDAGRGHDAEDWQDRIDAYAQMPPSPFRDAALAALGAPPNAEHISGWGDR